MFGACPTSPEHPTNRRNDVEGGTVCLLFLWCDLGSVTHEFRAEKTAKKPAGETLPALRNSAPVVNPFRPVSAAATGITAAKPGAQRPLTTAPAKSR